MWLFPVFHSAYNLKPFDLKLRILHIRGHDDMVQQGKAKEEQGDRVNQINAAHCLHAVLVGYM